MYHWEAVSLYIVLAQRRTIRYSILSEPPIRRIKKKLEYKCTGEEEERECRRLLTKRRLKLCPQAK